MGLISGPSRSAFLKGLGFSLAATSGYFIFIFFISVFYKNIFSIWKFTEIYPGRPAAGRPGPGRPAAGRQGLICKKRGKKLRTGPWEPAAGRPASQAAPLRGGRPPLYKGVGCPSPSFALLKIQKKEKRGRERRGEGEAKRRSPVGFSRRRLEVTKIFHIL